MTHRKFSKSVNKIEMPERMSNDYGPPIKPLRRVTGGGSNWWEGGWPETERRPPRANVESGNGIAEAAE